MTVREKLLLAFEGQVGSSVGDLIAYALSAGALWLFFYVLFRQPMRHRRISRLEPTSAQVTREVLHSLRSIFIFGLVSAVVVYGIYSGWSQMYGDVAEYGWPWFWLSIGVMILMHDAYFYWTHRLMHSRLLYRRFHYTHHISISPTPWAAYAFSPIEALVQAGIGPFVVFTVPVHPAAFGLFMLWQISFNVFGHCGYEIYPRWFMKTPVAVFLNSVTHHAQHHEKFQANYSLYFNIWDRLMGTNHPEYEQRFELATGADHEDASPKTTPALSPTTQFNSP